MGIEGGALYRQSATWQRAMELTASIYHATRAFPADERFGLTNQLRRASVSIPSNIAEGKGRISQGERMQFLGIARGSAFEVTTQIEIALMQGFGDAKELLLAQSLAIEVTKMLNSSIATMRENKERQF